MSQAQSADFDLDDDSPDQDPREMRQRAKTKRFILNLIGRWYWVALGLALGILGGAYYLSKAPEKYAATATVLIKQQTAGVMGRDQVDEIDMRTIEAMNTVAERILRAELLERVATRTDVRSLEGLIQPETEWRPAWLAAWFADDADKKSGTPKEASTAPPAPPALAGYIGSWMKVSIRRGTRLIDISIQHEVPEIAQTIANAIAREYITELVNTLSEERSNTSGTLLSQSEEVRTKLQAAESGFATYVRALELNKALEDQENIVSQLTRRYLPKHPTMVTANSQLESLQKRFLDEFLVATQNPSDASYWQTVQDQITATADDPAARLRVARQLLLARAGVLRGEINSQMSVFNAMLTRAQETNVNIVGGNDANVDIHSLARHPGRPSSPQRPKVFAVSGICGIGIGLAFALLLVRIDNKFNSVAQVEQETQIPVLAAISLINDNYLIQAAKAYAKSHKDEKPNERTELWDPHLIFRQGTSHTTYAEMFRVLRASVSLLGDESTEKITVFSSALPGEGKSTVSANFALAAASQGRKTLFIDLDLRKPSSHRIFGFVGARKLPGIADWLTGVHTFPEIIQTDTGAENLHIILCGGRTSSTGELINSTSLKRLFAEASAMYDCIVVDTAPILAVPDTRVIAPLADHFCLVVRSEYVPRGAVHRVLEVLESANTRISGLVFNGYKESRRMIGQNYSYGGYRLNRYGRPYHYGYGTYGSYGSDAEDPERSDKEILKRKKSRH